MAFITPGAVEQAVAGSSPFLSVTKHVSSGEILTMGSSPVVLIAPPGAGFAIIPVHILPLYNFATTAYFSNDQEVINWAGEIDDAMFPVFAVGGHFLSATESVVGVWTSPGTNDAARASTKAVSIIENKALVLTMDSGASNPTLGDGSLDFLIVYVRRAV